MRNSCFPRKQIHTSVRIVVSYEGWYFSFSWGARFSIFSLSVFCFLSAPLGWTQNKPCTSISFPKILFQFAHTLFCTNEQYLHWNLHWHIVNVSQRKPQHTLKTLTWQLAECRCSVYSPASFSLKVSIWTRNGTPFSPPCLRMVNSVLIQWT